MVGALEKPNGKSVKFEEHTPADVSPWVEPHYYEKDEPFINPFTGKLVDVPSSSSSRPGPSAKEGPLKDTPSFWETYKDSYGPSSKHSKSAPQKLSEGSSSSYSNSKHGETPRPDPGNTEDYPDYTMQNGGTPPEVNIFGHPVNPMRTLGSGVGTIKRENNTSLPGTWVHSWTVPSDDQPTSYPAKPTFPPNSNISRTTSRIFGATNSWGLGWIPRTPPTFATAIQLEEMQETSQKEQNPVKSTASSISAPTEDLYASDGTQDSDRRQSSFTKRSTAQQDGKEKKTQWKAPSVQQVLGGESKSATYYPPKLPSDYMKSVGSKDTAPINISAPFIPPMDFNTPKYSPSSWPTAGSSSGISSAAEEGVWGTLEDEDKGILGYDSSDDEGVSIHKSQKKVSKKVPKKTPKKTPEKMPQGKPKSSPTPRNLLKYSPQSQNFDQTASDAALAERLALFEADFQKPSDLFEDFGGGGRESSDFLSYSNQPSEDLTEPDLVNMGYDAETLALIAELADGTPQDYDTYFKQEAANEALIVELSKGTSQDFDAMKDWELAIKLAEDSPQDIDEYVRQLEAQEEYARKAQEIWDEDIRRRDREEMERVAEIARREAYQEQERLRKERMAECVVCSDEGQKVDMEMLSCAHWYCADCIKLAFEGGMKDKKPFRCCDQVPISSVSKHFTSGFITEYDLLLLELNTPNALYCGVRTCSKFIPPRDIHGDTGTCRVCAAGTCRHCRLPTHTGICEADTEAAVVRELAKQKGWKPCPGCQHMIERNEGCLHMTCSKCRTEFCYNCGALYSVCAAACKR